MKNPHCNWVGGVLCAAFVSISTAAGGAVISESAATDAPPAQALGLDTVESAPKTSWFALTHDLSRRGGPSLRVPKSLLVQTGELAVRATLTPAFISFPQFETTPSYSSYDYLTRQTYRLSSAAVALGTTAERWLTPTIALQGSAFAGVGYATVGTIHGAFEGDYHYGLVPQGLLTVRVIFGDRAALDVTGRQYFVTGVPQWAGGQDDIARADASLTVRFYKQHSISAQYLWSRRDASYPLLGDRSTLGIYYRYTGAKD